MSEQLPDKVRQVISCYLTLVDQVLPDRIEGLHLVGSLAMHDYKEGQSDVDFVAIPSAPLSSPAMDRLDWVHQALLNECGRPWFDGIYVTAIDLQHNPDKMQSVPHTLEGRFHREHGFEANPIVWLTLRNHPLAVRGRVPTVWHDPDVVRSWTLANLNSYWADTANRLEAGASRLPEEALPSAIVWCVSGVARLAYTLATGDATSKSGACRWALATYPARWHPIVSATLAIREDGVSGDSMSRAWMEEVVEFLRFVIGTVLK